MLKMPVKTPIYKNGFRIFHLSRWTGLWLRPWSGRNKITIIFIVFCLFRAIYPDKLCMLVVAVHLSPILLLGCAWLVAMSVMKEGPNAIVFCLFRAIYPDKLCMLVVAVHLNPILLLGCAWLVAMSAMKDMNCLNCTQKGKNDLLNNQTQ